jgi:hypothetical protein
VKQLSNGERIGTAGKLFKTSAADHNIAKAINTTNKKVSTLCRLDLLCIQRMTIMYF